MGQMGSPVSRLKVYTRPCLVGCATIGVRTPVASAATTATCRFQFTKMASFANEIEEQNLFSNLTWQATDWARFELQTMLNFRALLNRNSPSTAVSENNRGAVLIPAFHPANPFGFDVVPFDWRPFTDIGTLPSHLQNSTGSLLGPIREYADRWKAAAYIDLSDTWTATAYYSRQENRRSNRDGTVTMSLPRLQLALVGKGGPNGNEWFNPFGSADKRSPFYVESRTKNSQQLVDWLHQPSTGTTGREMLEIGEIVATGELFDVPAGAMQMAAGYQWRDEQGWSFANPHAKLRQSYSSNIFTTAPRDQYYDSAVKAVFVEFEVPILETLALQLAGRHEQFSDLGLESTTPKVAMRWEALPTLAIRASWGESFLAPTPASMRPYDPNSGCTELFSGVDPFTTIDLSGATTCLAGNPDLVPETSDITNVGFTWEPNGTLDGLSISVDYQEVEYVDRIRALTNDDAVNAQFGRFLSAHNLTKSQYVRTAGSPSRLLANAWLARPENQQIIWRDPVNQRVTRVIRQTANISSLWIDLLDTRARYTYNTDNWGTFQTTLTVSYFLNYEYADLTGGVKDANGNQNANTAIVPPLPEYKGSFMLNWFRDKHSASLVSNFYDDIIWDNAMVDRYSLGLTAPAEIHGQDIWNVQYAYVFDQYLDSEIVVSAGLTNMFNQMPQRTPEQGGFESRLQDPFGRRYWVSIDWTPNN